MRSELKLRKFRTEINRANISRKSEAMNRPKKEFIPTSLSDLNIDSISLGSNGDRHNNNSNGARFNHLDRSKATSSYNLASYQTSHHTHNNSNFSHSSKIYGSQSNISGNSQSVNNFHINSPTSPGAQEVDRWEQAWEDNSNAYRPPSYQQQQRKHSLDKPNLSFKHSHSAFDFKRPNSINQNQAISNRSMNHYVDDPFDDPWSGSLSAILLLSLCTNAPTQSKTSSVVIIIKLGDGNKRNERIARNVFVCHPHLQLSVLYMLHYHV